MAERQTQSQNKLAGQVVDVIKTANDLLQEQSQLLSSTQSKLAQYTADDDAAKPLVVGLIEKLASHRIDGEFLIPPEQKQIWLDSVTSKHAFAEVADQLADYVIKKQSTETKTSSDLGELAGSSTSTDEGQPRRRRSYF